MREREREKEIDSARAGQGITKIAKIADHKAIKKKRDNINKELPEHAKTKAIPFTSPK